MLAEALLFACRAYRVSDDLPGGSLRSPCCVAIDPKGRGILVSESVRGSLVSR